MYRKLTEKRIKSLKSITGDNNVLTETADIEKYSTDESPDLKYMPETVLTPENHRQVLEIARYAVSEKFALTPRGGGTSLTGSPLPVSGGAVISFEKMNNILDIDTSSRMAVLQPGVITGDLDRQAAKYGLFYPVNPASLDSCTLGGNAATAAGGANTVRYGTTRNYLSGIKAVDGNAAEWQAGGKIVKNSTDQQLLQLVAGSEGTLSIFTSLVFRLTERPEKNAWIIAPFRDTAKVPVAAAKIFSLSLNPTMVELMDRLTLDCCRKYTGEKIEFDEYSHLLIRLDSGGHLSSSAFQDILFTAGQACLQAGAEDVLIAESAAEQEKIWKIRSSIHDAIKETCGSIFEEDVTVPVGQVSQLLTEARNISESTGYETAVYGHLGDGNIHVNFTGRNAPAKKIKEMKKSIFEAALKLGGKLSGEHGIGLTKKDYFCRYVDPSYVNLLRKVKKQFDPENILNPGKIF